MSPHKPIPVCNECPAHSRIEQRIDWLYEKLLPWIGVLTLVQAVVMIAVGAWITETVKSRFAASPATHVSMCP